MSKCKWYVRIVVFHVVMLDHWPHHSKRIKDSATCQPLKSLII